MCRGGFYALLVLLAVGPVGADVSAFVAAVGFDEEANLDGGAGFGVRWGKSSSIIGGETSLMIARPTRQLDTSVESATAIFYEARLLINIPLGSDIQPFFGVGFGLISLTSTAVPTSQDEAIDNAFSAVADAQTNRAISYGFGGRYALADKLDLRFDIRQYAVFSVQALATRALQERVKDSVGVELPGSLVEEQTVQYNELSFGLNFRF